MTKGQIEMCERLRHVDIQDKVGRANEHTVAMLEKALELARAGRMQEVLIVGYLDDSRIYTAWTETLDCVQRVGMVEMLKMDWHRKTMESEEL